jgi:dihydroorotate dehydrogenase electron transfer subunit
MNQDLAPVISQRETMPGVCLLEIESSGISAEARPGQFVMVGCDSGYGRLLRRPISIHQTAKKLISLLFAVVGTGTEWLSRRRPGDQVDILGPLGNGFSLNSSSRSILLVAGGMGIAPLCFLARSALNKGLKVKLLAGAATAGQLCPERLLPEGSETIICTEDGSAGVKGLVTACLQEHVPQADQILACGPVAMYRAMAGLVGDRPTQVSLEVRMGCGLGFCYACTIRTRQGLKQVCKDGPVFEIQDVTWEELG